MSKNSNDNDELNDTDIAELFASDRREPSAELDARVLHNARESQHGAIPVQSASGLQKYTPALATAAVLMIGIALAPLLMNSPESNLDQSAVPMSMPSEDAPTDTNESNTPRVTTSVRSQAEVVVENKSEAIANEKSASDTAASVASGPAPAATLAPTITSSSAPTTSSAPSITSSSAPASSTASATSLAPAPTSASDSTSRSTTLKSTAASTPASSLSSTAASVSVTDTPKLRDTATESGITETTAIAAENLPDVNPATPNEVNAAEIQVEASMMAPNALNRDFSAQSKSLVDQANTIAGANDAPPTSNAAPEYRQSALLWVIEIKHLYKDGNVDRAQQELKLYRAKFSNSKIERLLPQALQNSPVGEPERD